MYQIAIIGAGPAGLSAAARAAARDQQARRSSPSYILLEGFSAHAKTIQRYQKGKHVMAEPGFLDLRSDLGFGAGSREKILSAWGDGLRQLNVNIRHNAEVRKIGGGKGAFAIQLVTGETIQAASVVLAIGLEGNPRKLGAPGEDLERVQYQLDDPKEFTNETILVVGAGDSAIENALALAEQNDVWILNRGKEFSRAKDANLNAVVAAITDPRRRLNCYYETSIKSVTQTSGAMPLSVVMQTAAGEKTVQCHRIIARLGAIPPRKFVESIGIKFPNERSDAIPELSRHYESNVPGVYIIGSLAGYPLIKQAMNQGYDVVEFINGNDVKPADHPLLEYQFFGLPFERSVDEIIERFQTLIPMFRQMNPLAFRELVIESDLLVTFPAGAEFDDARKRMAVLQKKLALKDPQPRMTRVIREGEVIYEPGEFGTSFFTIVDGEVLLEATGPQKIRTRLGRGEFFGEMSLLSGRPRLEKAVAGPGCILVETPRRTMVKLINSNEEVRSGIDWIFIVRELQRHFAPFATLRELRNIATRVTLRKLKAGEVLFSEKEPGDSLFVLRSGAITLLRRQGDEDKLVSQVRSGQLIGEMALMGDPVRRETATANVAAELIEIKRKEFLELTRRDDARLDPLQKDVSRRVVDNARMQVRPEAGTLMNFLMDEGLGEATNVLVIDEALCVGCDNCEKACAETHEGVSRLDREAGATFANIHIPISCRHCEQPHCMKDCPPNALRRSESGEVYINETCIGCGNCEANCPYGVIRMVYDAPKKPGLVSWMLFAIGSGPGEEPDYKPSAKAKDKGKKATKCDACVGLKGGPACVRACPTGAAIRIGPEQFIDLVEERKR
ncbi:cyclic nucleotide-binding domain-containing protein [Steroidobacter flavus]|uniref:Cyclic nucleotide-binding domain-containing protein n=1 Tax=Steroidobacter flavus TaxID=1842136 RepID=A0ABV8SNA1_9GAMM